jgi:hypothetical protein
MDIITYKNWLCAGHADHRDRTPYKRAPESAKRMGSGEGVTVADLADEAARAYMDGWNGGIQGAVRPYFEKGAA